MISKGAIIYLNGVTSSGKTSIVEALREAGADFYYLSDDIFEDNIIDIEYDAPGYWEALAEAVFLMYRTAALFSDHGKTVVLDSMLLEKPAFSPHYDRMLEIFRGHSLKVVDVYCPLEICYLRSHARSDRYENQPLEQSGMMAQNVRYDLHLDTSQLTPAQCAAKIMEQFLQKEG